MKVSRTVFLVVLTGWMVSSCMSKLDDQSYIQWVRSYDNGLHVRKESGGFLFDVQYLPKEYRWLQDKSNALTDDGLEYYTLTISPRDEGQDLLMAIAQDEIQYQRLVYYLSYGFQQDLVLETEGVRYPCVLYHFERPADMKNSRTFMLGFEKAETASEQVRLIIESEVLSSLPVHIKIVKSNIPALAL